MTPDPVRAQEARAWLERARADLRATEVDLAAEPPSLEELGEQCLALDGRLRGEIDRAVPFTEFAWRFRYPGEPGTLAPEEAEEAFAVARALYDAVAALLPDEARP